MKASPVHNPVTEVGITVYSIVPEVPLTLFIDPATLLVPLIATPVTDPVTPVTVHANVLVTELFILSCGSKLNDSSLQTVFVLATAIGILLTVTSVVVVLVQPVFKLKFKSSVV